MDPAMPPQPPDSRSTPPLSPSATAPGALSGAGDFTDEAWVSVLSAVDRTYADLIAHQEQLERQNEELHDMQRFIVSIMESVNEIMAVVDREGSEGAEAEAGAGLRVIEQHRAQHAQQHPHPLPRRRAAHRRRMSDAALPPTCRTLGFSSLCRLTIKFPLSLSMRIHEW